MNANQRSCFRPVLWAVLACAASCVSCTSGAQDSLPDVPKTHWASRAVREVVKNNVLPPAQDKAFHGANSVTRQQAIIAIAKLARALESKTWQAAASEPLPEKSDQDAQGENWQKKPVSRYVLAVTLARVGDYFANGAHRADVKSKDTGKSVILPDAPKITVSAKNPAYDSLTYLAKRRMIGPDSPLLTADDAPLMASELSGALAQMLVGLNDRLTDLGHDEKGDTPDHTSLSKKPKK